MHEESSSAATDFALALDNNRRESRGLYVGIGFDAALGGCVAAVNGGGWL